MESGASNFTVEKPDKYYLSQLVKVNGSRDSHVASMRL
jgi:hypothetical protein